MSFLVFVGSFPVWPQSFQPLSHSIGLAEKIVIRGYRGTLRIVPGNSDVLKVEGRKIGKVPFDRWTFQMQKKENVVEILVKGPSEQEDWSKVRSGARIPDFDIKVTAPLKPLEIFWDEGQISVNQWNENLSIQMNHGRIETTRGKGSLVLHLIKGLIRISGHRGSIGIQSFNGRVFTKKTEGTLDIDNHSAVYEVTGHQGTLGLRNYSGSVLVSKARGPVLVRSVSGRIHLENFDGTFNGDLKGGSLDAKVKNLRNFVVKSEQAPVTLTVPRKSGARVSLRSQKGRVIGPAYLQKVRRGLWKERRGRLRGQEQGHIKIVSKYGKIVLK